MTEDTKGEFPELDPLLLQLLWNRGLRTQGEIDEYLNPDWGQDVHDPYLFRDMRKAVERVYEAIGKKESIGVFGDYDADGVCAAATVVSTLRKLGAEVVPYLPHREREGYGLNEGALRYLNEKGCKLAITCDCGIANVAEVSLANELGLNVIVTDHHRPKDELPPAYAVLHCGLEGETYPWKSLSGGGVAFKFVQGLLRYEGCQLPAREREMHEKWLLDLVAVSTVADMVPLKGENRTLVSYGLTVLRKNKRLGLKALLEAAGLAPEAIDTYTIGFHIAPRINAAGRMDHANSAFSLLMAQDEGEARELARALNLTNSERQRVTDEMFLLAEQHIGELSPGQYLVHAFEPLWPLGMVGLVAGKLVKQYNRPALVMCENKGRVAGSGRSGVGGFDLMLALNHCRKYLANYGGHAEAAGFALEKENLEPFLRAMEKYASKQMAGADLSPVVQVDAELPLASTGWGAVETVDKLEPVGQANPPARFVSRGLTVSGVQPVGAAAQHVRLVAEGGGATRKFIAFSRPDILTGVPLGSTVDIVYEVGVNEWNGNRELELKVIDVTRHD